MEVLLMENEVKYDASTVKKTSIKNNKKRLITIIGIIVVFIAIIVIICISANAPKKVAFNAPGKFGYNFPSALIEDPENGSLVTPPDSSKLEIPHYEFVGWFDNKEGNGEPIDFSTKKFTDTTIVYGIWNAKKYAITYDYDGGSLKEGFENPVYYYINHTLNAIENNEDPKKALNTNPLLFEPVKNGYTFVGWKINNGDTKKTMDLQRVFNSWFDSPIGDVTIQAIWQ